MRSTVEPAEITMYEAPIENPGSMGLVERYQAPLTCAYEKLNQSLGKGETTNVE